MLNGSSSDIDQTFLLKERHWLDEFESTDLETTIADMSSFPSRMLAPDNIILRNLLLSHYANKLESLKSNDSIHLAKAYAVALRYGDIEMAKLVSSCINMSEAKYRTGLFETFDSEPLILTSSVQIAVFFSTIRNRTLASGSRC